MSVTIDQAFVKQFESDVHVAYQDKGSKLRGTVRTKSGVIGSEARFQKYGQGTASTKTRHGMIQTADVAHTYVDCTLADYYFGEWVDKLDELKTNIDERMLAASAGAMALGRKSDDLIIAALDSASTNTVTMGTSTKAAFKNKVLEAIEKLNAGEVPQEDRWGVVGERFWSWLLLLEEFINSRYIGPENLPFKSGIEVREWLGVRWMVNTRLTRSSNDETAHLYHKSAVGHAVAKDVSSDITWHGDRAAHFIANSISQGAVLIDGNGTCKMVLDVSAALATS